MDTLTPVTEILLVALVVTGAVYDVKFRRIPNWLTILGVVAGFAVNAFSFGVAGLGRAGLGCALALLIYVPLFALRAMGGGDVKLMAAVGSIAGPNDWFVVFVVTAIVGGIMALGLLCLRGGLGRAVRNVLGILSTVVRFRAPFRSNPAVDVSHSSAVTLPHGVSIAIGSLLFLALRHYAP